MNDDLTKIPIGAQWDIKSLVVYRSYIMMIQSLADKFTAEDVVEAYNCLFDYGFWGIIHEDMGVLATLVLEQAKPLLDSNRKKSHKNAGAPKGNNNNPNGRRGKTNQEPIGNQSDIDTDIDTDIDVEALSSDSVKKVERKKSFVPPTLQQIQDYIQENNMNCDAEAFHDYYESVGWKVGSGKPMKDWQAALRNWSRKESKFNQNNTFKYENNRTGNSEAAAAERRAAAERVIARLSNKD